MGSRPQGQTSGTSAGGRRLTLKPTVVLVENPVRVHVQILSEPPDGGLEALTSPLSAVYKPRGSAKAEFPELATTRRTSSGLRARRDPSGKARGRLSRSPSPPSACGSEVGVLGMRVIWQREQTCRLRPQARHHRDGRHLEPPPTASLTPPLRPRAQAPRSQLASSSFLATTSQSVFGLRSPNPPASPFSEVNLALPRPHLRARSQKLRGPLLQRTSLL